MQKSIKKELISETTPSQINSHTFYHEILILSKMRC